MFTGEFVDYYNHHHWGIGLHTSADVHYSLAPTADRVRTEALAAARRQHPNRFATDHDPKILDLPAASWSNEPKEAAAAA